jgi:DNA-binding PadR family transcriptional regulator
VSAEPEFHEQLPLSEAVMYILVCMAPGPQYGYAMLKEIQELSRGRVILSTGTLYGAIKRLLADGWIQPAGVVDPDKDGRERKAYALTRRGRNMLAAEASRLDELARIARLRLGREAGHGRD